MNSQDAIQNKIDNLIKPYRQAILLDGLVKPHQREILRNTVAILLAIAIVILLGGKGTVEIEGVFFLLLSVWLAFLSLEFFYNSFYFRDGRDTSGANNFSVCCHVAGLLDLLKYSDDIVSDILETEMGQWVLFRAGISRSATKAFLAARTTSVHGTSSTLDNFFKRNPQALEALSTMEGLTLAALFGLLMDVDDGFRQFILASGIEKAVILGAANWLERREHETADRERWWSRDALGRIPGLAKDWAYGQTYLLDRFSQDLMTHSESFEAEVDSHEMADDERAIEQALSRSRDANALIVGDLNQATDILYLLARKIREGTATPEIKHCRMVVFDTLGLIDATKEKTEFERQFMRMLDEAERAGNIILIIEHLAGFLQSARSIGSDAAELLEPYLGLAGQEIENTGGSGSGHSGRTGRMRRHRDGSVRIIAFAEQIAFHQLIEPKSQFVGLFEKILLKNESEDALTQLLEREAENAEARGKGRFFFTYGALRQIAESVDQYFGSTGGDSDLNKARDLLVEIVSRVGGGQDKETGVGKSVDNNQSKRKNRLSIIGKAEVLAVVGQKTGIPLGEIADTERGKLLNLESILHERIIGQNEAITAISNAMRRARSGISNPSRPIGSFLFLGPTGVGKTETTKALAFTFFGNENQILRLDMSEYSGEDALHRLVGSFDGGAAGILTSMLRDKQYGVLLLDEFEKASREVHDLFLQILDEGFFSDMNGKRVNARNTIIIATSNAGSDLIFKAVEQGAELEKKQAEIVDEIIVEKIFRPELLNRFDGVILFHPLGRDELQQVAVLQLKKLSARIEQKGIRLNITPDLVSYLVSVGADPKFGARSMNRAIQENVEQVVARKIISGEAAPGSVVSLTADDLKKLGEGAK